LFCAVAGCGAGETAIWFLPGDDGDDAKSPASGLAVIALGAVLAAVWIGVTPEPVAASAVAGQAPGVRSVVRFPSLAPLRGESTCMAIQADRRPGVWIGVPLSVGSEADALTLIHASVYLRL
jgi:hypothetical protein